MDSNRNAGDSGSEGNPSGETMPPGDADGKCLSRKERLDASLSGGLFGIFFGAGVAWAVSAEIQWIVVAGLIGCVLMALVTWFAAKKKYLSSEERIHRAKKRPLKTFLWGGTGMCGFLHFFVLFTLIGAIISAVEEDLEPFVWIVTFGSLVAFVGCVVWILADIFNPFGFVFLFLARYFGPRPTEEEFVEGGKTAPFLPLFVRVLFWSVSGFALGVLAHWRRGKLFDFSDKFFWIASCSGLFLGSLIGFGVWRMERKRKAAKTTPPVKPSDSGSENKSKQVE